MISKNSTVAITLIVISAGLLYFTQKLQSPKNLETIQNTNNTTADYVLDIHESHLSDGELVGEYTSVNAVNSNEIKSGELAPWRYRVINHNNDQVEIEIISDGYSDGICTGINFGQTISKTIKVITDKTFMIGTCNGGAVETYYWNFEYHTPYAVNSN